MSQTTSQPAPSPTHRGPTYRALQGLARGLFGLLADVRAEGEANFPAEGPYLVVINHLHVLDVPAIVCRMRHRTAAIAYEAWAEYWLAGGVAKRLTKVISVNPEKLDPRAMAEAARWLADGGVLLIAPEGERSPTGALIRGQAGAAYLAGRTGAPVVPVVAWGQERALADLRRLARPSIHIRVGQPFVLGGAPKRARGAELEADTERIMLALAALLPPAYRGVYGSP